MSRLLHAVVGYTLSRGSRNTRSAPFPTHSWRGNGPPLPALPRPRNYFTARHLKYSSMRENYVHYRIFGHTRPSRSHHAKGPAGLFRSCQEVLRSGSLSAPRTLQILTNGSFSGSELAGSVENPPGLFASSGSSSSLLAAPPLQGCELI